MFLTGRGTLASCPRQEETRNQRVPVAAAGSGPLAGKLARVPRVVRMSVSAEKSPTRVAICCRKADPFQGPKLGSCLTLGNELPEETHELTKQEIFLGKGTRVESSRVRKPKRTALLLIRKAPSTWDLYTESEISSSDCGSDTLTKFPLSAHVSAQTIHF